MFRSYLQGFAHRMAVVSALSAAGFVMLAAPLVSNATILVSDDFEGATPPNVPVNPPWNYTEDPDSGTGATLRVLADTSDRFGAGTDNQILRFRDTSGGTRPLAAITNPGFTSGSFVSVNFDFYEPGNDGLDDPLILNMLQPNAATNDLVGSTQRIFFIEFDNGDIAGEDVNYVLDQPHHVQLLFNSSATDTVDYGAGMVGPNSADIWLNGNLVADDVARNGNGGNIMGSLAFFSLNGSTQEFFIDNLDISDEPLGFSSAVVPEPTSLATFAIAMAGGLAGWFWQRRRRG